MSIAAITAMFIELSAAMSAIDKLNISAKSLNKTTTSMIKMSLALLILSSAMKKIGELNPTQLIEGLVGVGVLLAEIAAFLKVASFNKGITKAATGMIIFAAAIKILASAAKTLASLSWGELIKGLVGVGVLLAEGVAYLDVLQTQIFGIDHPRAGVEVVEASVGE